MVKKGGLKIINIFLKKMIYASYHAYGKLPKELKNDIEILAGQAVFKFNNSRTAWPTYILVLFLSFLDNLL